ncbi:MAG TPA: hypothetical protein PKX21_01650 [Candidatus Pacearchaeota archaeon]|nr:hypothetical protein [Candidatus Pacearchaeota archaeon]
MALTQNKNIIILAALLLIAMVVVLWSITRAPADITFPEEDSEDTPALEEVYSTTNVVSEVDLAHRLIIMPSMETGEEIKVYLDETTEIFRIVFPEEADGVFKTEKIPITLEEVKAGDLFFIKSHDNIVGQTELRSVDYIEFMP